jgi:putative hemolysin
MTIALVVAGLLLVAVLTAAAAAVRSVNRIWLRHWVEERLAGGAVSTLSLDDVQRVLLAASTAVALVAFATGTVIGTRWSDSPRTLIERTAIAALLILVAGQLIPRAIGRRWDTALVSALVPALRGIAVLLAPIVSFARALVARMGADVTNGLRKTGEREALADLLREGELEGVGDADESAIISGVVDFTEKRATDVMTKREDIFALDRSAAPAKLVSDIAHAKYSRVPLFERDIDHVVGMVHSFDALKWESGAALPLRKVGFASDKVVATEVLFSMLRERVHLTIIQDATQRTVGLVTLEDLLEELVGDIRDEHDEPAAPA